MYIASSYFLLQRTAFPMGTAPGVNAPSTGEWHCPTLARRINNKTQSTRSPMGSATGVDAAGSGEWHCPTLTSTNNDYIYMFDFDRQLPPRALPSGLERLDQASGTARPWRPRDQLRPHHHSTCATPRALPPVYAQQLHRRRLLQSHQRQEEHYS
jgi:hypothetical protein